MSHTIKIVPLLFVKNSFLSIITFLLFYTQFNFAQNNSWEQTNGPYSTEITAIAINNEYIFAGSDFYGMYRSTNKGDNWTKINNGLSGRQIFDISIDKNGVVYVAAFDQGVFRSNDNGDNWESIRNGLIGDIWQVTSQDSGNYVFAGSATKGVFRSIDNGESWQSINNGLGNKRVSSLSSDEDGKLFAGTDSILYYSENRGDIWKETNLHDRVLDFHQIRPNYYLSITSNKIFSSIDKGLTWEEIEHNIDTGHFLVLYSDVDENIFLGTSKSIYYSINDGNSWQERINGLIYTRDVKDITSDTDGNLFAGTGGGFYCSTNKGENWRQKNQGFEYALVNSILIDTNDVIYAGTHFAGVHQSTDYGENWQSFNGGIFNNTIISSFTQAPNGEFFAAGDYNLFKLDNEGGGWIPTNFEGQLFSIAVNSESKLFAGTLEGVYYSTDNGNTWWQTILQQTVYSVAISSSNIIYAAIHDGIYKSSDDGQTWEKTNLDEAIEYLFVYSDHIVFACTANSMYRTINGGESWELVIESEYITTIDICPNGNIYAGVYDGSIFYSTDSGKTWGLYNPSLQRGWIRSIAFDSYGHLFVGLSFPEPFAGTGGGVVKSSSPITHIDDTQYPKNQVFNSFVLYQNYPNPFNSITNIRFYVPQTSVISLKIYDTLGKQVENLINNDLMSSGDYIVQWTGKNNPSGIYFYQISFRNHQSSIQVQNLTKKLVILK